MFSASSPLKLRLLYRLAGSKPPERITCVSSALFARLCPGLNGGGKPAAPVLPFCVDCVGVICDAPPAVRCVGVVLPVGTLVDESVLPAPRRYRPGDGFAGDSPPNENDRSRLEVESVMDGAMLSMGFLRSLSSLVATGGPADERLEEPEVDTVESEEEEGWEGWPRRVWLTWLGSCCRA